MATSTPSGAIVVDSRSDLYVRDDGEDDDIVSGSHPVSRRSTKPDSEQTHLSANTDAAFTRTSSLEQFDKFEPTNVAANTDAAFTATSTLEHFDKLQSGLKSQLGKTMGELIPKRLFHGILSTPSGSTQLSPPRNEQPLEVLKRGTVSPSSAATTHVAPLSDQSFQLFDHIWQKEKVTKLFDDFDDDLYDCSSSDSDDGDDDRLGAKAVQYWKNELQSFDLLDVVIPSADGPTRPRQRNVYNCLGHHLTSIVMNGDELEQYNPDRCSDSPALDYYNQTMRNLSNKEKHLRGQVMAHAWLHESLQNLDMDGFHMFLGETGDLAHDFVMRGEEQAADEEEGDAETERRGEGRKCIQSHEGEQKMPQIVTSVSAEPEGNVRMHQHDQLNKEAEGRNAARVDLDSAFLTLGGDRPPELGILEEDADIATKDLDGRSCIPVSKPIDERTSHTKKERFVQLRRCNNLVPEIFFSPDYDLTDPKTFDSLSRVLDSICGDYVSADESFPSSNVADDVGKQGFCKDEHIGLEQCAILQHDESTNYQLPKEKYDWLADATKHLEHLETLHKCWDSVELSLLEQVRYKSEEYFRESARLHDLEVLVSHALDELYALQDAMLVLRNENVVQVEDVPNHVRQRKCLIQLQGVLDLLSNVFAAKSSVANFVQANDIMNAMQLINETRSLLSEEIRESEKECGDRIVSVGMLESVSNVSKQLDMYEQLMVDKLANAMVDRFMSWKTESSERSPTMISSITPETREFEVKELAKAMALFDRLWYVNKVYTLRLCELIKVTVKTTVTEFAADCISTSEQVIKDGDGVDREAQVVVISNITSTVSVMPFDQFFGLFDLLLEQLLAILQRTVSVDEFLTKEDIILGDSGLEKTGPSNEARLQIKLGTTALSSAFILAQKSVSDLLRLRQVTHSNAGLIHMKRLWDRCDDFILQLEKCSKRDATELRAALLSQAKAFVALQHEKHLNSLSTALEKEKWLQCDVSQERQDALVALGFQMAARFSSRTSKGYLSAGNDNAETDRTRFGHARKRLVKRRSSLQREKAEIEIEGDIYRVVWSSLLLVEMIAMDLECAEHFRALAPHLARNFADLVRLFNRRTFELVLGAGAINSAATLKTIKAKHLAFAMQSIGLIMAILPNVRLSLMENIPAVQHCILPDLDEIEAELKDHKDKFSNKFVTIIGGIIEEDLAPLIPGTDFDHRAMSCLQDDSDGAVALCPFLEGVVMSTTSMHHVLSTFLPPNLLRDVLHRIFVHINLTVPSLLISFSSRRSHPKDDLGKSSKMVMPNKINTNNSKSQRMRRGRNLNISELEEGKKLLYSVQGDVRKSDQSISMQRSRQRQYSSDQELCEQSISLMCETEKARKSVMCQITSSKTKENHVGGGGGGKAMRTHAGKDSTQHQSAAPITAPPLEDTTTLALPLFSLPRSRRGKQRMVYEIDLMAKTLNHLHGSSPFNFTIRSTLEREFGLTAWASKATMEEQKPEGRPKGASHQKESSNETPALLAEKPATKDNMFLDNEAILNKGNI